MTKCVREIAARSRAAAKQTATADTATKNALLLRMASLLKERHADVLTANKEDMMAAKARGVAGNLLKRLRFDHEKLMGRIEALKLIAGLPDPVGEITDMQTRPNGLMAGRMRVPLGVILMIYEARPHVTVNGAALTVKSGNAVILRGGSEALRCNRVLGELWTHALDAVGLPSDAIQVISCSHDDLGEMLALDAFIDMVIPRGGEGLINAIAEQSRIPVIKHFEGICHVYVGVLADTEKALRIILDSKLLMPGVCNAAETILVDQSMEWWIKPLVEALSKRGVEVRGCPFVREQAPQALPATDEDWSTEYLDTIYSIKVVRGIGGAVEHISTYGSGHTDAIVTEDYSAAHKFVREVDSAVVLVNASTMFCDGRSLGMGAEVGISTDRLHARGPMGLRELTTYKHVVWGQGQVMGREHLITGSGNKQSGPENTPGKRRNTC